MKTTLTKVHDYKSGMSRYTLSFTANLFGKNIVLSKGDIYSRDSSLNARKLKKLILEQGFKNIDDLFCNPDRSQTKQDSVDFAAIQNWIVRQSEPLHDEQEKTPLTWYTEFKETHRKTEHGALYVFFLVIESGCFMSRIPWISYGEDANDYDKIIDFADGKIVHIYGKELAKRCLEAHIRPLMRGAENEDFEKLHNRLVTEASKYMSRVNKIN